jgi:hypothetical protein
MATSFINQAGVTWFQEAADTWFETFKKSITVHKEPIKTIVSQGTNQIYGYNDSSVETVTDYTPVNQSFDAVIDYSVSKNLSQITDLKIQVIEGDVAIHVKEDCKNYLTDGKVEKITFDGKSFNLKSSYFPLDRQGNIHYYFILMETK